MKRNSPLIAILGILIFIYGLLWSAAIYNRCSSISPADINQFSEFRAGIISIKDQMVVGVKGFFLKDNEKSLSVAKRKKQAARPMVEKVKEGVAHVAESSVEVFNDISETIQVEIEKVRRKNPHIKGYHVLGFWFLVVWELFVSFCLMISGWSLFRSYPFSRRITVLGVWSDILLKASVISYMYFCAIPLERVLHNANIIVLYYETGNSFFVQFSLFATGLRFFFEEGRFFLMGYCIVAFFMIFIFSRSSQTIEIKT